MSEPEQPSPFSELFIVDSIAQDVVPSLPFYKHSLGIKHAFKFLVQGQSSHYESFIAARQNEKKILAHYTSVGKVFATIEGEVLVKSGSAFFVSPTVLCTAGHVGYIPQSVKSFTFARHAPSEESIQGQGDDSIYRVSELGTDWVQERRAEEILAARLDRDPLVDVIYPGIAQCDFAFLRVHDYVSPTFLFPSFNYEGVTNIVAIGYPGSYSDSALEKPSMKALHRGRPSISAAFANDMGSKHVGPGRILKDNGRILAHDASTLRGSSGGPIVDHDTMQVVGIHIEGWKDVEWNVAVSTRHPVFQRAYREFVYPTLPDDAKIFFDALNPA